LLAQFQEEEEVVAEEEVEAEDEVEVAPKRNKAARKEERPPEVAAPEPGKKRFF
jgi:hypothetical protein